MRILALRKKELLCHHKQDNKINPNSKAHRAK